MADNIDGYGIRMDGFSDEENTLSSDDDVEGFLSGLAFTQNLDDRRDSDEEFVNEMEQEINTSFSKHVTKTSSGTSTSAEKCYSDIYFDSDESDEEKDGDKKKKSNKPERRKLTNDELLYDPNMDNDDQKWVDDLRRSYHSQKGQLSKDEKLKPLPQSDAVLNCPACMTTLCLDCQRHAFYQFQYRAMFVMNCDINFTKTLSYSSKSKKKRGWKKKSCSEDDKTVELYHPVLCSVCKTQVAVYDYDEVYHFFNVIAGHT